MRKKDVESIEMSVMADGGVYAHQMYAIIKEIKQRLKALEKWKEGNIKEYNEYLQRQYAVTTTESKRVEAENQRLKDELDKYKKLVEAIDKLIPKSCNYYDLDRDEWDAIKKEAGL